VYAHFRYQLHLTVQLLSSLLSSAFVFSKCQRKRDDVATTALRESQDLHYVVQQFPVQQWDSYITQWFINRSCGWEILSFTTVLIHIGPPGSVETNRNQWGSEEVPQGHCVPGFEVREEHLCVPNLSPSLHESPRVFQSLLDLKTLVYSAALFN
jgi:hypothetical protein